MNNASELLSILEAASYPVTATPGRLSCQLHEHLHFSTVQISSHDELFWRQRNITLQTSRCKQSYHTNSGSMGQRANGCIFRTSASAQAYPRFPPHRSLNCSCVPKSAWQESTSEAVASALLAVELQPVLMAVACPLCSQLCN